MKNRLRNLSGFKQGPAQSMSVGKYDYYSREEHKTMFPNLKFTYGGAFGSVKSVTEKTDWEKAGKPVITPNYKFEDWKKEFDEQKKFEHERDLLQNIQENKLGLGWNQKDKEEYLNRLSFLKRDKNPPVVSEIKPEGINLNVGDNSLPPVHIQNTPVVKNAKEKKTIVRPIWNEESRRNQVYADAAAKKRNRK